MEVIRAHPDVDGEAQVGATGLILRTPLGEIGLAAQGGKLTGVYLPDPRSGKCHKPSRRPARPAEPILAHAAALITRYTHGEAVDFCGLPLDWDAVAPRVRAVLRACAGIPRGRVATYGELAKRTGSPGAARFVGSCMARNPWPLVIPCHRVVGANGNLTGFGGGLALKERLLQMEGALLA